MVVVVVGVLKKRAENAEVQATQNEKAKKELHRREGHNAPAQFSPSLPSTTNTTATATEDKRSNAFGERMQTWWSLPPPLLVHPSTSSANRGARCAREGTSIFRRGHQRQSHMRQTRITRRGRRRGIAAVLLFECSPLILQEHGECRVPPLCP